MGFRNPYGITCDPATALPLVAENGFDGRDQVRLVPPRSNHEWPFSDRRDQLTPPLYDSGLRSIGPTAIAAREHNGRTEIFFTAWHSNALYRLTVEPDGTVSPLNLVHRTRSGALSLAFDQGGCLLVADVTSITRVVIEGCVPPPP
jgi:hypothetical protein